MPPLLQRSLRPKYLPSPSSSFSSSPSSLRFFLATPRSHSLSNSPSHTNSYSTTPPPPKPLITLTDLPAPHTGRIRILALNRPAARNAISRALLTELRTQIDAVAAEYEADGSEAPRPLRYGGAAGLDMVGPTRALIVASEVDGCFCAGADLKERKGFTGEETTLFLTHLRSTLALLSTLPIPTISALSGPALGGGLELALSTTFRVVASSTYLALPETRLGIIPGAGGTYRLPALVGLSRARDMVLTGRRVGGAEAYFWGLADRLVEILPDEVGERQDGGDGGEGMAGRGREKVLVEAVGLARGVCEGGPVAVRAGLEAVTGWERGRGGEVENKCYERVVRTEDRDEALRAFGEKRRPAFKGR